MAEVAEKTEEACRDAILQRLDEPREMDFDRRLLETLVPDRPVGE